MITKIAFLSTAGIAALGLSLSTQAGAASVSAQSLSGGQSYAGGALEIENFIGVIEIREGGDEITVAVENTGGLVEDPMVSATSSSVRVDGGQTLRRINCNTRNNQMRIGTRFDMHDIEEYPRLVITAPADTTLSLHDSAYRATAGDLGALDLGVASCGDFESGDIAGDADIFIGGSGDVITGTVGGNAEISINGSGDIETGRVAGYGEISINGSGDVETDDFGGDVEVSINGSGDVRTGDVSSLQVSINGSGDVAADALNGAFQARIGGSGDITIDRGRAEPFSVDVHGSGDVSFGGTAVDVRVNESGSGDVEIADMEGSIDWRRHGRSVVRSGGYD